MEEESLIKLQCANFYEDVLLQMRRNLYTSIVFFYQITAIVMLRTCKKNSVYRKKDGVNTHSEIL